MPRGIVSLACRRHRAETSNPSDRGCYRDRSLRHDRIRVFTGISFLADELRLMSESYVGWQKSLTTYRFNEWRASPQVMALHHKCKEAGTPAESAAVDHKTGDVSRPFSLARLSQHVMVESFQTSRDPDFGRRHHCCEID